MSHTDKPYTMSVMESSFSPNTTPRRPPLMSKKSWKNRVKVYEKNVENSNNLVGCCVELVPINYECFVKLNKEDVKKSTWIGVEEKLNCKDFETDEVLCAEHIENQEEHSGPTVPPVLLGPFRAFAMRERERLRASQPDLRLREVRELLQRTWKGMGEKGRKGWGRRARQEYCERMKREEENVEEYWSGDENNVEGKELDAVKIEENLSG